MQEILLVIDMQNDFVTGALGSKEACAIVPNTVKRIEDGIKNGERIIFTRDTHETNYLSTQEGKNLPVEHCIRGTEGWELIPELVEFAKGREIIDKPTFGSVELGKRLQALNEEDPIGKITLIGLCTDICVISNAMIAKATLTEVPVAVEKECCAGVTPASHDNALAAMTMCQIKIC